MNCLLCDHALHDGPTWQQFFGIDRKTVACPACFARFERIDQTESTGLLDHVLSLYAYDERAKDYLHHFKFLQDVALAEVFADELGRALRGKNKTIVPVPMHPENKRRRTFGQVEALLEAANVMYETPLVKTTESVMGEKSRAERLAMTGLFTVSADIRSNGTYVLVDDIYTTGTTLQNAARVLKEAGAERVEAVTLFRSIGKK